MAAPAFEKPAELVDSRIAGPQISEAEVLERIRLLANLMDNQFQIPGTNQRVGLDALLGLIPGVGDLITALVSGYLIYLARSLNVSKTLQARMVLNLALDTGLGLIPVAGDVFDFAFKANLKNLRLLEEHLRKRKG